MADSLDRERRRRSLSDMVSAARAAAAPLRRSLAVSLLALGGGAQAMFSRHLDGGYDPGPSNRLVGGGNEGITVRNLSVCYGERYALENLTGEFAPASLTAVIGPNGAGKSSLLKALAGVIRPTSGEVVCPAFARHRLAYLPQQDELDRDFPITVAELVALGDWRKFGSVREVPPGLAASVHEAVAAVGLSTVIDRPIAELSVGQFQRALFARLLLQDADVILLDEPFASLDERTTEELLQFLQRWREEGRTVVAVLHDLDRVRQHFPSTLLLARVPIAWGATPVSLTADNLARAQEAVGPPESDRIGRAA
ncbi:metal ABC transporter ATP-binding protein [Bradyrhizobium sp.]|uniref:metal ABC transporter ATP-binding protein n=1 Tax=Bradyrhizobium sp. TaxID=376 RepID=UPI003C738FD3